jgi:hypothetical protein
MLISISLDTVKELAPEETLIFKAQSEYYFKDPKKALSIKKDQDEMLGFGFSSELVILTPIILEITKQALIIAGEIVKDIAKDEAKGFLSQKIRTFVKKFSNDTLKENKVSLSNLKPETLQQIRESVFQKALQLSIPEEKADLLVDSIIGKLAITL